AESGGIRIPHPRERRHGKWHKACIGWQERRAMETVAAKGRKRRDPGDVQDGGGRAVVEAYARHGYATAAEAQLPLSQGPWRRGKHQGKPQPRWRAHGGSPFHPSVFGDLDVSSRPTPERTAVSPRDASANRE